MADSVRARVANSLVWTTDQIQSGRGQAQVRIHAMYLDDLQKKARVSLDKFVPRYVLRVLYVEEDPGGAVVEITKSRSGILGLLDNAIFVARNYSLARTIVEDISLEGSRAEPVTASVKGVQSAAFRVIGRKNKLYVLDPAIGGGTAKQTAMRNRIVSRINGEIQAGPTIPETKGPVWNAVPRLIDPQDRFNDPRSPMLDGNGQLVLTDGEHVLYSGRHPIAISRNEQTAYGGGAWKSTVAYTIPADLWITDRRVAVQWRDWRQDSSSSLMIERRRQAGFPDAASEESSVAGQLSWAWIASIFVNNDATDPGPTSLEFQASDNGVLIRFRILGTRAEEARRLSRAASAAVALYRLSTDNTVTDEERSTLEAISQGNPTINQLDWGEQIVLPSSFKIGQDPQSLNST